MIEPCLYLGRYQQGEELPIVLACSTPTENPDDDVLDADHAWFFKPADPGEYPYLTIYRHDGVDPIVVDQFRLGATDRGGGVGVFRRSLFLGEKYTTTGRYVIIYRWVTATAVARSRVGYFYVLPGGHPDGHLIAQAYLGQPDSNHLIAQTDAGHVIRGRNPR